MRSKLPKELEAKDSPDFQLMDIRMLEKFSVSKDDLIVLQSLVFFNELVKNSTESSRLKLYDSFRKILKGTYAFSLNKNPTIFREIDKILTQFAYMGIPDEFCNSYEQVLMGHPSKISLTNVFKKHREMSQQVRQKREPINASNLLKWRLIRSAAFICVWILFMNYILTYKKK